MGPRKTFEPGSAPLSQEGRGLPGAARSIAGRRSPHSGAAALHATVRGTDSRQLGKLREALDVGIAELDAGLGVELTVHELMAEASADAGL